MKYAKLIIVLSLFYSALAVELSWIGITQSDNLGAAAIIMIIYSFVALFCGMFGYISYTKTKQVLFPCLLNFITHFIALFFAEILTAIYGKTLFGTIILPVILSVALSLIMLICSGITKLFTVGTREQKNCIEMIGSNSFAQKIIKYKRFLIEFLVFLCFVVLWFLIIKYSGHLNDEDVKIFSKLLLSCYVSAISYWAYIETRSMWISAGVALLFILTVSTAIMFLRTTIVFSDVFCFIGLIGISVIVLVLSNVLANRTKNNNSKRKEQV